MSAVVLEMETGVASYAENAGPTMADQVKDASAVRWLFNPAARIDVRDRVIGYEPGENGTPVARRFIPAGTLTPVRNVTRNVPRKDARVPAPAFGNPQPRTQTLVAETKYAVEVAEELTFAYAETGLVVIDALTGIEDERAVSGIVRMLFGGKIKVATDPLLSGERIPVIPAMMESLTQAPQRMAEVFAERDDPALQTRIETARTALIASCRIGLAWARSITDESRRLLKSRTPNGGTAKIEYDDRDRRAFAALGEPVPQEQGYAAQDVSSEQLLQRLAEAELKRTEAGEQPRVAELEERVRRLSTIVEQMQNAKEQKGKKSE